MRLIQAKAQIRLTREGSKLLRAFHLRRELVIAKKLQALAVSPKVRNLMRHVRQMLRIDENNVAQGVELFGEDGLAFCLKRTKEREWTVCVDASGTVAIGAVNLKTATVNYKRVNLNSSQDVASFKSVADAAMGRGTKPELKLVGVE